MKILVTGAAGFIGMSVCQELLGLGHSVVGIDNFSAIFGVKPLMYDRIKNIGTASSDFEFQMIDICDELQMRSLFNRSNFDVVYHFAGYGGVRNSTNHPMQFTESNLVGFGVVLEACRIFEIKHLIFASSSSVYGDAEFPCTEDMPTDTPKSYYAATKKSNEVMAASYASLYKMKITGVRMFTVYGPWGRPDMAVWRFTDSLINHKPLTLYDQGRLSRDFTFISDVVDCLLKFIDGIDRPHLGNFQIYNIGSCAPVKVMHIVNLLEELTKQKGKYRFEPMDNSDVFSTRCVMQKFKSHYTNEVPHTKLENGLSLFVDWFNTYQTK